MSEDGETRSRGHLSVQLLAGSDRSEHNPEGIAGWPSRQCPIAHGCRAHRLRGFKNNVGLGLLAVKRLYETAGVNFPKDAVVNKRFRIGRFGLGILPRQKVQNRFHAF